MLGLPKTTEIAKQLPKKAIFQKFELKPAQRDAFDADISRIDIVNVVSPNTVPGLNTGERVGEFYVLMVTLKHERFDEKNILLLTKLIKQNMVFALVFGKNVRLAVVHEKLFLKDWEPLEDAVLPLIGVDMDKVWEHIVTSVGSFEVQEGATMEEQIASNDEKEKLLKQIEALEKKLRVEKQPRKKYELHKQILELKDLMSFGCNK